MHPLRYKWWWRHVKRPFTYIMRQWSAQNRKAQWFATVAASLFFALALFAAGGIAAVCIGIGLTFASALWGHLYWDTPGTYHKGPEDFDGS